MRFATTWLMGAACAALVSGCAPRLDTPDDGPDANPDVPVGPIIHQDAGNGVTITTVDASDLDLWLYMKLGSAEPVDPDTPEDSEAWDLGFRRFHIKLNGGASGAGRMAVAVMPETPFEEITMAPAGEYISDAPDDDDADEEPQYVLSVGDTRWYSYTPTTHVLTARDTVYVIRSVEGAYYKLQVHSYYNSAGSPGYLRFRWAEVAAPPVAQ